MDSPSTQSNWHFFAIRSFPATEQQHSFQPDHFRLSSMFSFSPIYLRKSFASWTLGLATPWACPSLSPHTPIFILLCSMLVSSSTTFRLLECGETGYNIRRRERIVRGGVSVEGYEFWNIVLQLLCSRYFSVLYRRQ